MTFDVVIATNDRHEGLKVLVTQILRMSRKPEKLIVIDSSKTPNDSLTSFCKTIVYRHTRHMNQPYQRYLGVCKSSADIVIFFDDDVEIVDTNLFDDVLNAYQNSVVGVGVNIDYQNNISELGKLKVKYSRSSYFRFFSALTGVHVPKPGEIAKAGVTGGSVTVDGYVHFLHGPMMSFKRDVALKIFDTRLFNVYGLKVGKGEDKYLSMGALQYGKLFMLSDCYVRHPLNESHYYVNPRSFQKRVIFSRWLLTRRLAEIRNESVFSYGIHFLWFVFWRLIIIVVHALTKPTRFNREAAIGQIEGVAALFLHYRKITRSHDSKYWSANL